MSKGRIFSKTITDMIKEIKKSRGAYEAKRLERAADEVPNLERLYQKDALEGLFRGENARGIMTMRPEDFERYAVPLGIKSSVGPKAAELARSGDISKGTVTTDKYIKHLQGIRGGFNEVPYLQVNKEEAGLPLLPYIAGHEGRHRMRALAGKGQPSALVTFEPRAELREPFPRRSREEYIEAIKQELGLTDNMVTPEFDGSIIRPDIELPDVYKGGGAVRKADGGAATYNEAMLRRNRKFSQTDLDQMRREVEENARRIAEERQARLDNPPPAEMTEYNPTLQQKLGTATEKGLKAVGATTPRARALADVLTGGRMGSPFPLGMSVMDFTPAAIPVYGGQGVMNAADAAGKGNYGEAALELGLAGLDLAAAYPATKALARAAKPMVKAGAKAMSPKVDDIAMQYMMKTGMALPIDVWHGSPHRFPPTKKNPLGQFDATKIGTGEGAQAYGQGHYMAEAPKVAKNFMPRDLDYEGKLMRMYKQAERKQDYASMEVLENAMLHNTPEELLSQHPEHKALIDKIAGIPQKGSLYKVDLPDEQIAKMLNYDKPINEHSDELKALLEKAGINAEASATAGSMIKGQEEYLAKHGIPGIYYLDDASRDVGEGTRNFVVFPGGEEMLTIKERMKEGGKVKKPVSMDAMRLAVGGMAGGGRSGLIRGGIRSVEEAKRLYEIAQKNRSKAAQVEAGLYHPIGGGVKLSQPIELMTSKTVANPNVNPVQRRIITPEDMQGGIALPLIGDRAAAGRILTEVGGKRLSKPVELQGGPGFMQTHTMPNDESAAWASGQGVISRLGGLTRMAADMGGTDKIYAPYVSMSQTGVDFNTMVTQAILGQYDPSSLTKKAKKDFLNDVRNYVPDKKKPNIKPGSVLTDADLDDVDALREKMLLPDAGPLRKVFVERMGIKQFQNQGFPDVAAARLATTEPDLLNVDVGSTGYNIARLNPEGRIIKSPLIPHETYPEQLGGEYFGSLDQPVSYKEFFPGFADAQRLFGKPEKHDWYTFGRTMPLQQLDQEWVDRIMKSMGKDAPREWKKGGQVKRMAEGGQITSDDLIIEERKL